MNHQRARHGAFGRLYRVRNAGQLLIPRCRVASAPRGYASGDVLTYLLSLVIGSQ